MLVNRATLLACAAATSLLAVPARAQDLDEPIATAPPQFADAALAHAAPQAAEEPIELAEPGSYGPWPKHPPKVRTCAGKQS